jgi:hypothetical protein
LTRATLPPAAVRRSRTDAGGSGTLPGAMLVAATDSLGFSLALIATFIGIGVIVNVLIIYVVVQALGERKQNREREEGIRT